MSNIAIFSSTKLFLFESIRKFGKSPIQVVVFAGSDTQTESTESTVTLTQSETEKPTDITADANSQLGK